MDLTIRILFIILFYTIFSIAVSGYKSVTKYLIFSFFRLNKLDISIAYSYTYCINSNARYKNDI